MEMRLNANAVITNSKGEFLLVRLKKGPFKGGLCIPGGGVEPGELSHETARREVQEETGIVVDDRLHPFGFCELRHEGHQKQRIVLLLHGNAEGIPQETEEGSPAWYSYEDAEAEMIPFCKEAIRIWKENQMHFTLLDDATGGDTDYTGFIPKP